jgi:hypothetical protein
MRKTKLYATLTVATLCGCSTSELEEALTNELTANVNAVQTTKVDGVSYTSQSDTFEPWVVIDLDAIRNRIADWDPYTEGGRKHIQIKVVGTWKEAAAPAFANNDRIALVDMRGVSGMTKVPASLFKACTEVRTVMLPDGIEEVGNSAFESCLALRDFRIPKSVKSIGDNAFLNCNFEQTLLSQTVQSIGEAAFYAYGLYGYGLKFNTLPEGITVIPERLFKLAHFAVGYTDFVVPKGVTRIADEAFVNSNITSLTLPSTVTEIGDRIVNGGGTDILSVTSKSASPARITLSENAFPQASPIPTLYVPQGCKSDYEEAGWGQYFSEIVEKDI